MDGLIDGMSRTNSSQAMMSLFSAYAPDEEVEEDDEKDRSGVSPEKDEKKVASLDDQFSGSENETVKSDDEKEKMSPRRMDRSDEDSSTPKKLKLAKRVTKLVSYGDAVDDAEELSDDEDNDDDVIVEGGSGIDYALVETDEATQNQGASSGDGELLLPPEPPGKCSRHLQDKVSRMYAKITSRTNLNHSIQRKKEFRNPSIYEKLIQFCGIDEKGTNYPPELYDPSIYGQESFYTELAKIQKEEMDKKEKERKDKTKIEFVSGVKKGSESLKMPQERRSKWDTQQPQTIKGAEVVSQSVTMSSCGNKTTVISAVGTLKKSKS